MHSKRNQHTPLSPSAERAFNLLETVAEQHDDGIPVTRARSTLQSADEHDDCLSELLNKGYLYEVSGKVYVT